LIFQEWVEAERRYLRAIDLWQAIGMEENIKGILLPKLEKACRKGD
jgi:hypothetical protein